MRWHGCFLLQVLLEMILLHRRALTETELWSSLVKERVLGQRPSVFEVVVARPRIIHQFHGPGIQDGVDVDFLHLVARDSEAERLVRLAQERL